MRRPPRRPQLSYIDNKIKPPNVVETSEKAKQDVQTTKLLCCYPTAPLLKKYDISGNYTMAGDLACRSELFMKVDLVGSISSDKPHTFHKTGNVYQCVLCGAMYRLGQDGSVFMLLRDKWVVVDPVKGHIHLSDGTIKTVVMHISDTDEVSSNQYINKEREEMDKRHSPKQKVIQKDGSFSEFNI